MITPEIIEEVKNRLVTTYHPETIYLFGSYAWGNPNEESDLDLLVVIKDSEEKSHKRTIIGRRSLFDLGISKDLVVYTKEEFDTRASDPSSLLYKIKYQGKVLYARS